MNVSIVKNLNKIKTTIPFIFPYQLGTVDFIIKNVTKENPKNLLIYHYMGTGKTNTCCFAAFILSTLDKNVYIIATNEDTINLFTEIIDKIFIWTYYVEKRRNIKIITKDNFKDLIKKTKKPKDIINRFENSIIFIDEAHQALGNTYGDCLIELNKIIMKEDRKCPNYVLLSGSPIINTFKTLRFLFSILLREDIIEADFIKEKGKIIKLEIAEEGYKYLKRLNGSVSFYIQDTTIIPKISFVGDVLLNLPVILCKMSDKQKEYYYSICDSLSTVELMGEMFLKNLMLPSFSTIGKLNIEDFEKTSVKFTDDLFLKNGDFYGDELVHLKNSCKIKYFFDKFVWNNTQGKAFIYFTAATIGGKFLRDCLYQQGVKEFGTKNLPNFVCVFCRRARTCEICIPMTYIMITSKYETKINDKRDTTELLHHFNKPNNDDGSVINFIFGSKKVSESYTFKEVMHLVYLSTPETIGELIQSLGRVSRVFSHKNILTAKLLIYLLMAVTGDSEIEKKIQPKPNNINYIFDLENITTSNNELIDECIEVLSTINNKISFDIRKLIYLELKSENNIEILNRLKQCHQNYEMPVDVNVQKLYIVELVKRFAYNHNVFKFETLFQNCDKLVEEKIFKNEFQKLLDDQLIVTNKDFGKCILHEIEDNKYIAHPIFIEQPRFINKIPIKFLKNFNIL